MAYKVMFSFPGQGAQCPGLLSDIPNRDYWMARAQMALNRSLEDLDSAVSFHQTESVQLALLIKGVSCCEQLSDFGVFPDIVCGLSIGAYTAAVCSGALSFEDALNLVSLRGKLMQQAYPTGYGMTAIIGLRLPEVEVICRDIPDLYVANYNAETQIVISGSEKAMQIACDKAYDIGAEKCIRLRVFVPSHCPLLSCAAKQLNEVAKTIKFSRPQKAYLSATSGRVLWKPEQIADDLVQNMARRTQWHEAVEGAFERGVRLALEMPPGETLTKLTRASAPDICAMSVVTSSMADITQRYANLRQLES